MSFPHLETEAFTWSAVMCVARRTSRGVEKWVWLAEKFIG